jgi:uncharacterized membrane protein YfcA
MNDQKEPNQAVADMKEDSNLEVNVPTENTDKEMITDASEEAGYFIYLNRIITAILSNFIAVGLIVGSALGVEQIFGTEALADLDIRAVLVFVLLTGLSLFLSQSLQNYFVKIIEKESYKFVLGKTFKNFIWQTLNLVVGLPLFIYAMSIDGNAVFWTALVFVMTSNLVSMSIREDEHNNRLQAGIFGCFAASVAWGLFSFTLYQSSSEIWQIALLMILPIQALLSEIVVSLADLIQKYIKD